MTSKVRILRTPASLLACLGALAGCGVQMPGSLGLGGERGAAAVTREAVVEEPILPVRRAQVEPALRGVILRVETVAPTQGWHEPALAPASSGDPGVRAFTFGAAAPEGAQAIGPERTRVLVAAVYLSRPELRGIRALAVNGTVLPVTPR